MGMFELPTHLANNLRNHAMYIYSLFFPNKSLDLKLFEKSKKVETLRRVEPSTMGEDEPCSAVGQ